MSGINKPLKVPLLIKRGTSAVFTVQALPEAAPAVASAPIIPDDVVATTQQAVADGKAAEYLAWLTDQGAPAHILDYVRNQAGVPNE
jgi:hypothetical protein